MYVVKNVLHFIFFQYNISEVVSNLNLEIFLGELEFSLGLYIHYKFNRRLSLENPSR